jgi:septal ring factor EnvC (AmiA/AmiB activator)
VIRPGTAALLLLLAAAPGAAAAGPARSREAGAGGAALKAQKEALGEVRRQLDQARTRATAARTREVSLLAELEEMERTVAHRRADLTRLDARIVRLEGELKALEGVQGRVAEDMVLLKGLLVERIRSLDRLRRAPGAPGWIGETQALARGRAAEDLARVVGLDLSQLVRVGETVERLHTRRDAVTRGRRELVLLRRAVDAERTAVDVQVERRRALLAEVQEDRATHETMAAELAEAGRRLETLVQELTRRAEAQARARRRVAARPAERGKPSGPAAASATAALSRPPGAGLEALKGQLPWPVEGRVVEGFGRQVHPRFGTETFRTGVSIEAAEGAVIRAVFGGVVAYRGWLKGYGNLIILDHGQGYYTLYAHASEFLVEEGAPVKGGQGIARVGDTGSLAGSRLHFEVRYQGRPEDPREWLRRRLSGLGPREGPG